MRTTSDARSEWKGRILRRQKSVQVVVDGQPLNAVRFPSLESLERRYEADSRSWLPDWLKDESDPTQPE